MEDIEESLALIKTFRKTITKRKARKQSLLATNSGRTYHELILEEIFKMLDIEIETDTIFCFKCNHSFKHAPVTGFPSYCPICLTKYEKEKPGQFIRPDILLKKRLVTYGGKMYERKDKDFPITYVIIYVNGMMHNKEHFQNKDYHQIKHLLDNNIKVIVIENEMIENSSNDVLAAFCRMCYDCTSNTNLYTIYKFSSEPFNRILKPMMLNR